MTTPLRSRLRRMRSGPGSVSHRVLIAVILVLNFAVGIAWLRVAPGQQFKVFSNGSYLSLPTADYHPFEGLALFVMATGAIGLVSAVAIWRVRAVRGIVSLAYLVITCGLGAVVAAYLAGLFSSPVSPLVFTDSSRDVLTELSPQLTTPLALVAEPLVAALVYTFLVAWDGRPDLGRRSEVPRDPDGGRNPAMGRGPETRESAEI